VCDEPVSASTSIQAQIVNLLMKPQREFNLSLILISHDLSVHISHRILVLYLGRVMEVASRDELYANPRHPYTQALISTVPIPDPTARPASRAVSHRRPPLPIHRHRAARSAPAARRRPRCAPRPRRRRIT
jgi:oligopeptide transport system ATP-binding protein